ncbi:MAG: tRNA uridine-5-carboxymethylaminomethyl(34) synthesis GTPase MnmE [Bacteroidales bacterium]|nr:tRNA uridine-5-carboxymethylaminomethyl(34) synthesis GTPase MnmE [Bacteroidales bacterium]
MKCVNSLVTDTLPTTMRRNDTIVAVATPAGVGGLAVIRLSGADALTLALKHLSVETLQPRNATYCRFDDLDDGVATYFPTGYTGESTVEFCCHGSLYVQQALVQALVDSGARLATAGEYTLRAFLNGRLNLSQAEAVADLIDAVTPAQHHLAVSQLRGGYAQRLKELRQQLLDLTSLLELELDFSQEDVEFADRGQLHQNLSSLSSQVTRLVDSFATGNALKQGIPVAIVGAPNVGKSTLLNALLDDDRAIVSDIPGTTRDTVDGLLTVDGITFRLIDTAGLRQAVDEVERLGIARSRKAREEADIIVEVWDASMGLDVMSDTSHDDGKKHIRVLNKCDLIPEAMTAEGKLLGDTLIVCTAAKSGRGIDRLKASFVAAADVRCRQEVMLSNVRHRDALVRVGEAVTHADEALRGGLPADLVVVDLRDALYHLGTITGEVSSNEVLDNIFSRFCVGK